MGVAGARKTLIIEKEQREDELFQKQGQGLRPRKVLHRVFQVE